MKKTIKKHFSDSLKQTLIMDVNDELKPSMKESVTMRLIHRRLTQRKLKKYLVEIISALFIVLLLSGTIVVTQSVKIPEYLKEIGYKKDEIQKHGSVEILSLREENVKHFAFANGEMMAYVFPFPIHKKTEMGTWEDLYELQMLDNVGDFGDNIKSSDKLFYDSYFNKNDFFATHSEDKKIVVDENNTIYCYFKFPTFPEKANIVYASYHNWIWKDTCEKTGMITLGIFNAKKEVDLYQIANDTVIDEYIDCNNYVKENITYGPSSLWSRLQPTGYTFDITSLVDKWIKEDNNYGFFIKCIDTHGNNEPLNFYSSESRLLYPQIIIKYRIDK